MSLVAGSNTEALSADGDARGDGRVAGHSAPARDTTATSVRRRPRVGRPALAAVATALLTGALASCGGGQGVTIPNGSEELTRCDPQSISLADLATQGEPGCDLEGSSVRAADGTILSIFEVGAVRTYQGDGHEYTIVNWGVPGVGVSAVDDGTLVDVWASTDGAEALQREQLRLDGVLDD